MRSDPGRASQSAAVGSWGEAAAAAWYTARGYVVVARNWRCPLGEIDLVLRSSHPGVGVVFVEVKARTSEEYGLPWEAVTASKRRRVRRAASSWLAARRSTSEYRSVAVRFDVAAVTRSADGAPTVEVFEDAF